MRPNLEHLRKQAKTLLSDLRAGNVAAANTFIEHLAAARAMTPAFPINALTRRRSRRERIARGSFAGKTSNSSGSI